MQKKPNHNDKFFDFSEEIGKRGRKSENKPYKEVKT